MGQEFRSINLSCDSGEFFMSQIKISNHTLRTWNLTIFTAGSHRPPPMRRPESFSNIPSFHRNVSNFLRSHLIPYADKTFKVIINDSVDRLVTTSICNAFVAIQMKMARQPLMIGAFRSLEDLKGKGPTWSISTLRKWREEKNLAR